MLIPPLDNAGLPALTPPGTPKTRGEKRDPVAQTSATVRLSPVARRLGGEHRDPNLDPTQPRRSIGEPALERDDNESVEQAIQRALAGSDDEHGSGANELGRAPTEDELEQDDDAERESGSPPRRDPADLSREDRAELQRMQRRDQEVRQHERAHQAAAGGLAGAARLETATGPDGRQYAIGGEVPIDVSPGGTPEQTVQKSRRVRAAALAPNSPSGADKAIAARAQQLQFQAEAELREQRLQERETAIGRSRRPRSEAAEPARRNAPNRDRSNELAGIEAEEIGIRDVGFGEMRNAVDSVRRHDDSEAESSSFATRTRRGSSLDEAARSVSVSFRSGGVLGGHAHASLNCSVCSAGLAAYRRSAY